MRLRELFLASTLTVTFGCPSGDDGETDANTTMVDTGHETEHNHDSSGGGSSGGGDSSSGGGGESSSSGGGGESSSSGGGGDSTSGGVSMECVTFCTRYLSTCGDDPANDYGDQAGCETACEAFDEAGFDCRTMHLELAMDDPATHCPHASNDGGGVC